MNYEIQIIERELPGKPKFFRSIITDRGQSNGEPNLKTDHVCAVQDENLASLLLHTALHVEKRERSKNQ